MGLQVTILGVAQDMDFDTGHVSNLLSLCLADGTVLRALVDDDAAAQVIRQFVSSNGAPITSTAMPAHSTLGRSTQLASMGDDPDVMTFGGVASDVQTPTVRQSPAVVQADDFGNPVIVDDGLRSSRGMAASRNQDEDGVASI